MVYMLHLFRDILLDLEVQGLKVLGLMVVPGRIQVLVSLTMNLMVVTLVSTLLANHVSSMVIASPSRPHFHCCGDCFPLRHRMSGFYPNSKQMA